MKPGLALQRYLQRYCEPLLPNCPADNGHWRHVVVIPAYRESPALLETLAKLAEVNHKLLVIIVLNRPDSDTNSRANQDLRDAIDALPKSELSRPGSLFCKLTPSSELYVHDLETLNGPSPAAEGVGLARKAGCDLALAWIAAGGIASDWICTTDADAQLPADYFEQLETAAKDFAAAVFPFRHIAQQQDSAGAATELYELRLHHYVLGLEYAGSPYTYHALGSCMAMRADNYAQVRGFPKRAGAEDFYVLNKLAKTGNIARLQGECIAIHSRESDRVPFGTGPAVNTIMQHSSPIDAQLFYHPLCFEALRAVLSIVPNLFDTPDSPLQALLEAEALNPRLAAASAKALYELGFASALEHCHRQGKTPAQFERQFHQWFDGFRTLKFIHALRDGQWPQLSLAATFGTTEEPDAQPDQKTWPKIWPDVADNLQTVEELCDAITSHWGWRSSTYILN